MSKEKLNLSEMSQVCGGWFITGQKNNPFLTVSQEEYNILNNRGIKLSFVSVNDDKFKFSLNKEIKYSDLKDILGPDEF